MCPSGPLPCRPANTSPGDVQILRRGSRVLCDLARSVAGSLFTCPIRVGKRAALWPCFCWLSQTRLLVVWFPSSLQLVSSRLFTHSPIERVGLVFGLVYAITQIRAPFRIAHNWDKGKGTGRIEGDGEGEGKPCHPRHSSDSEQISRNRGRMQIALGTEQQSKACVYSPALAGPIRMLILIPNPIPNPTLMGRRTMSPAFVS